jgi:hypothetical protein
MLKGKGVYIWMIRHTLDGDVEKIADTLEAAGMTHAWIKVADGSGRYNIDPQGVDRVPGLVAALRMRGISVWGWQYVYGRYPDLEAKMAIQRIKEFDLDGFIVNAEFEYKSAGASAATWYMKTLRTDFPYLPIGLSSYRFPSYHRDFPFDAFLEYCDFNAPQVYWMGATNPGEQLVRCLEEFRTLVKVQKPIFPTGAAFKNSIRVGDRYVSWKPSPAEVVEFMETAVALGFSGFNFWELRNCLMNLPEVWQVIRDFQIGEVEEPEEPEEPGEGTATGGCPNYEVVTETLNVRSGPGTHHSIIGKLHKGDRIVMQDLHGHDAWIEFAGGFVAGSYKDDRYVVRVLEDG